MKSQKTGEIHGGYVIRTVKCPLCGEKTRTHFPAHGEVMRIASCLEDRQAETSKWTYHPLTWIETVCLACEERIDLGMWTRKDLKEYVALQ